MSWLSALITSTVGRKYFVGASGLFLCLFLVIHLIGNLLLYVGPETYNEYAHKLHSNPEFLIVAEVLLYGAFLFHIVISIWLQISNRSARSAPYAMSQSKREDRVLSQAVPAPDTTMLLTGSIVFMFILVHLADFKFELFWKDALAGLSPYHKARIIVADLARGLIYLVGSVVLGIHVTHGFQSAFQSLGLSHPKYTPTIRRASLLFGLVVALGFGSFPIMAWMRSWGQ